MQTTAKIVADSVSPQGVRITTLQLCYPRFIHAEFMTHRVFSRNASSSRAIPVAKMIEQVRTAPAMPCHWGANQPGMQADNQLNAEGIERAKYLWDFAADHAAFIAEEMNRLGLHKQVANRILEPFQWMHVIVTATEWRNFFELRRHKDAEPNIQVLANMMFDAMLGSEPVELDMGEWHLPYVVSNDHAIQEYLRGGPGGMQAWNDEMFDEVARKVSAARCARVSYLNHDGTNPSVEADLKLYDRLVGGRPIHASPVEHQATPLVNPRQWSNNFRGWKQFREQVEAVTPS